MVDGGGYITGVLFHPATQGLMYMRTDVGGTYRRDHDYASRVPLNDATLPEDGQYMGIWSFAADPSLPTAIVCIRNAE